MRHIPNLITLVRILVIGPIALALMQRRLEATLILFAIYAWRAVGAAAGDAGGHGGRA